MTIYALCSKPIAGCLTNGKRYGVLEKKPTAFDFFIIDDEGDRMPCDWEGDSDATWTRIEETDPPQWALDKAANMANWDCWDGLKNDAHLKESVSAHAATLAKYETEPVDPVLVKARELLAWYDSYPSQELVRRDEAEPAIMEALRLPAMGDDK